MNALARCLIAMIVLSTAPSFSVGQQGLDSLRKQVENDEAVAPRPAAPVQAASPFPEAPDAVPPATAPSRPVPVRRLPVPLADALKPALAQVKDIFGDDYSSANTPEKKFDLGRRFLTESGSLARQSYDTLVPGVRGHA